MQRRSFAAAVAATSALLLLGTTTPAIADGQPILEHWEETTTGIAQDDFGPGWCDPLVDFEVAYHWYETGNAVFRQRGDGNYAGQSTYQFFGTFTNTETERYLTVRFGGINKDQDVVDNGDGTLTITVNDNGHLIMQTQENTQIVSIGRQIAYYVVLDINGTPGDYSDDTLLYESDPTRIVGNDADLDFCQILADHIG